MTWADEVDIAMEKGKSPHTVTDLLRLLREGRAEFYVWPKMHASAVIRDGVVEIGHVYGEWTKEEADELWARLLNFCKKHGKTGGVVHGRKGWQRFLKMKGFQT